MRASAVPRKKDFKKGIDADDARRKREDNIIELRKAKRDEQLQKKRVVNAGPSYAMEESSARPMGLPHKVSRGPAPRATRSGRRRRTAPRPAVPRRPDARVGGGASRDRAPRASPAAPALHHLPSPSPTRLLLSGRFRTGVARSL
jgi:hypothetical protein